MADLGYTEIQLLGRAACWIFVGIYVLSEKLNFGVTEVGHLAGFCENRIRSPAAFFAAREWNDAVSAKLVAALNDGDISSVRVCARGKLSFEAFVGLAIV